MTELVSLHVADAVATITLNDPARNNGLTPNLLEALLSCLAEIQVDPTTQVVVLRANGRCFSIGEDINALYRERDRLAAYASQLVGLLNRAILTMLDLPQPIITAVNGVANGGAIGLVLASDIVFATPRASFAPYYSVLGFSPHGGWTAMLPSLVGARRTASIIYHNHTIRADQALEWGIATHFVTPAELDTGVRHSVSRLCNVSAGSIRHTKQLMSRYNSDIAARLEQERRHFVAQIVTEEARAGIEAFLQS